MNADLFGTFPSVLSTERALNALESAYIKKRRCVLSLDLMAATTSAVNVLYCPRSSLVPELEAPAEPSPTYTADLAELLADMVETEKYGVYHATNEGFCSWADFAKEIFRQAGKSVTVTPVPSTAYPTKATRPKNSRMSKASLDRAGFHHLPAWQDALGRYLKEL